MPKTLDYVIYLSIFYLKKLDKLIPGSVTDLAWFSENRLISSVTLFTGKDGIDMNGGKIYFDQTPCNYRGNRFWFLCPACNRRCGVLYGEEFVCRKCVKLNYGCQYEDYVGKIQRKLRKHCDTNFVSGLGKGKPKHQHHLTYIRNLAIYQKLVNEENVGYSAMTKRQLSDF